MSRNTTNAGHRKRKVVRSAIEPLEIRTLLSRGPISEAALNAFSRAVKEFPQEVQTANLLSNPGAETGTGVDPGTVDGWTVGGNSNPGRDDGTFDGFTPHSGSYDFYGGTGSSGTLSQTVNLVNDGVAIGPIEAGEDAANVQFFEQSLDQGDPSDTGEVSLTFLDAAGNVLSGGYDSGAIYHFDDWQEVADSVPIPAETRSITYTMIFTLEVGFDLDAFIDDNSLTISTAATHLAFGQQPTDTLADETITPPVTVKVEDSSGQIVTGDNSDVTIAIDSGPEGASLDGTLTQPAMAGVATFDDLSLDTPGTYTLTATDGSLTSATSTEFKVTVPAAPEVTTNPISQTVVVGETAIFTAAASGNPTPEVQWEVSTDGGATFADIPGATSTTYSFVAASNQNGEEFDAIFTNSEGAAATLAATVTVAAPVPLRLHVANLEPALATGKISPVTGESPLVSTATVTNQLDFWLGASTTNSGAASASAIGSSSSAFAADGLIAPDSKASYTTTFFEVGDRVAVGLSMSAAASVMNLLDIVLPASAWKPSSKLVDELDKIYKGTVLRNAAADLRAGAAGLISTASAAHAIAEDDAELFANGNAQWNLVKADLKAAGVALTASEITTLETVSKTDKLAKTLIATAGLDTQLKTGAPIDVDFTAAAG